MRKVISLFLIAILLIPSVALPESAYTPKLGMTIEQFLQKYNAVQTALGSPYIALETPVLWTEYNESNVAWFYPCEDKSVTILLCTTDKNGKSTASGLDMIQICSSSDWMQLISVTNRCAGIFASDFFGTSLAPLCITDVVAYAFENNSLKKGLIAYRGLDSDQKYAVAFFKDGEYYFQISVLTDLQ